MRGSLAILEPCVDAWSEGISDGRDAEHLRWVLSNHDAGSTLANTLLEEFGSFAAIFAASSARQFRVTRDAQATRQLAAFRAASLHLARARIADQPLLGSWQHLLDYLHTDLAHRSIECVRVLFLNTRNVLIKDELMWTGTIDECSFHVRQVVVRALEVEAASMILVHNHPSGDPKPSHADIDLTRALTRACKPLGIAVHDHIIISPLAHSSMRAALLI